MTTAAASDLAGAPAAPLLHVLRFEVLKLLSQGRLRVVLLACWVAPALFVAEVSRQSVLPTDTVFGRWMSQTGWAGPLVVLAFSGTWALPLLTSLVSGDVFASEDRLGTWRHLVVAVRSPRRIFVAKALASLGVVVLMAVGLAASSTAGGLAAVGNHPLVGLDGHLLSPTDAARTVALAWAFVIAPTLAFAAVGLLGSVAFGRSPMGLLMPALLAMVLQVSQLLPSPPVVRAALPSYGFIAWRGLFTDPALGRPLVVALAVSLAWAVAATAIAYLLFVRRDFTDVAYDGSGRRFLVAAVVPLAALVGVSVVAIGTSASTAASGIRAPQLEASLATAYAHLYRLQTEELHRPAVTESQLRTTASCDKGGSLVEDQGPGNDWRCVVSWRLPGSTAVGQALYQLDVTPDGRYVADGDGPKEVNGFFQLATPYGDAANPLWQVDGIVDPLTSASKGR